MQQDELFLENWRAALVQAVIALGGCAAVGKRLWPTRSVAQCETKLANCLNPDHDWKLDLEEIVLIVLWAREKGVHCAMYQLCDETLYQRPPIVAPKHPLEEKAERLQRLASEFGRLAAEVAAETRSPLKSVS